MRVLVGSISRTKSRSTEASSSRTAPRKSPTGGRGHRPRHRQARRGRQDPRLRGEGRRPRPCRQVRRHRGQKLDEQKYTLVREDDYPRRHRLRLHHIKTIQTGIYNHARKTTRIFDETARQKILSAASSCSHAPSRSPLGPKGRNVVIDKKFGSPTVTKDGVTVAKEIELPDPYENMGAQMVKEVASKTSDAAGSAAPRPPQSSPRNLPRGPEERHRRVEPDLPQDAASTRPLRPPSPSSPASPRRSPTARRSAPRSRPSRPTWDDFTIGNIIADAMDKVGPARRTGRSRSKRRRPSRSEDDPRGRRGHAGFDKGYLLPVLRHQRRGHGGRDRGRLRPHPREEDSCRSE